MLPRAALGSSREGLARLLASIQDERSGRARALVLAAGCGVGWPWALGLEAEAAVWGRSRRSAHGIEGRPGRRASDRGRGWCRNSGPKLRDRPRTRRVCLGLCRSSDTGVRRRSRLRPFVRSRGGVGLAPEIRVHVADDGSGDMQPVHLRQRRHRPRDWSARAHKGRTLARQSARQRDGRQHRMRG